MDALGWLVLFAAVACAAVALWRRNVVLALISAGIFAVLLFLDRSPG